MADSPPLKVFLRHASFARNGHLTFRGRVCQKYYALNVQGNEFTTGVVKGHTASCDPKTLPTDEEMRAEILAYLEDHGYDVRMLRGRPLERPPCSAGTARFAILQDRTMVMALIRDALL